jgi:hypothetical protein
MMTSPLSVPLLPLRVRCEEIRYKLVEPEQRKRDELRDGYFCSSFIAFPTMPHPFAVLATQPDMPLVTPIKLRGARRRAWLLLLPIDTPSPKV